VVVLIPPLKWSHREIDTQRAAPTDCWYQRNQILENRSVHNAQHRTAPPRYTATQYRCPLATMQPQQSANFAAGWRAGSA
jgi:hypothetical protein